MRQNTKKFGLRLAALMLALLLAGTAVLAPCLVSAEDGEGGRLIKNPSGIEMEGSGEREAVAPPLGFTVGGEILFEQPPYDPWGSAYFSDIDSGDLCIDDFWGATGNITDIHWYGVDAYCDDFDCYDCDPTGKEFEIIFYEDDGGVPGAPVAVFPNVIPTFTYLYTDWLSVYLFEADLGTPVILTEGWVSIQDTSPDGCIFGWLNSPAGNGNAIQNGYPIDDNLAFALTGEWWPEFGDAPEGALAYPATGVIGAFPTCKDVTTAGWVQHYNFGAWFGPGFDREPDGNHGLCPGFAPYDNDECFQDGDAGLIMPQPYTIQGGVVAPCGSSACEYEICLVDSYGDGWNSGIVDVFVNGNPVYTDLTLASGSGPECHPIPVGNGDEITVHYTAGSWSGENEYYIYDSSGVMVRSAGTGGATPGDVLPGELYAAGCPSAGETSLGSPCDWAQWGSDIDILIHNWMPGGESVYGPGYVNVLIDWNQDGQWQNEPATTCNGSMVPEHVLVDFVIPPQYDGPLSALGPPSVQIGPNDGYVWARFSITERPVGGNWTGEGTFEDGETEDYLLRVYVPPPVGGEAYPVSKASLLAPWIAVGAAIIVGAGVFVLRRHRS
jgi:hypothetical protein